MSTKSSAAAIMAWNWVVQSLAIFNQVDSSTLVSLVKKAPDDLGKDARETVSLRILESLFVHGNEAMVDIDCTQNTKISFDPSEPCEVVLQKILVTSEHVTELERDKWNVSPFIMHKRSYLPKSPFQKFKELLLEGSHPLLASLKEWSKLGVANTSENTSPVADVEFDSQNTVALDALVSLSAENKKNKSQESPLQESNDQENPTRGITEHNRRKEHEISIIPLDDDDENVRKDLYREGQVKRVSSERIENLELAGCKDPKNHILPNVSGEGQNSMENGGQNDVSDDELTDIAAKKEAFLSSQCTLGADFMDINDYTEISLCVKCNKGGQLLVCSSDACPIRVHRTCLRSAATLDENGNFFCPFCAYSRAISEYQEVKRRTSLARINLQDFLNSQRKRVRNEETPVCVNKEVHCKDYGISVGDHRSSELKHVGEKIGEASQSLTTDSLHQTTRQLRTRKRQFNEKESDISATSNHSGRSIKHKPQYICPPIPLVGRKRLQWTKSEEEILKEGVQRFSNVDEKGIPWKEILEFGRDVFHNRRTAIDLKDKWRNICRGSTAAGKPKL